jgi:hypothetical protein
MQMDGATHYLIGPTMRVGVPKEDRVVPAGTQFSVASSSGRYLKDDSNQGLNALLAAAGTRTSFAGFISDRFFLKRYMYAW